MNSNPRHKQNAANLTFYTRHSKELALKFDCVTGHNVLHKFPSHIHNSLCIGTITKGQREIIWSGKSDTIKQGELFIINKSQPHAINQISPHDYIAITIKGNLQNTVFENIIRSGICLNHFFNLASALKESNSRLLARRWEDLYRFLTTNHTLSDRPIPDKQLIHRSIEYIKTNFRDQISVHDISRHVYMSPYHFSRLFKQTTGLSPHNYLKQIRLSQSHTYLQQNIPVFDTAIETGFYDSSHFIKTFQTYMAVSPKKYQDSIIKQ